MTEQLLQWPVTTAGRERRTQRLAPERARRINGVRPKFIAGMITLALLIGLTWFGPMLYSVDPTAQSISTRLAPPVGFGGTWDRPLGTDSLGRDLLARVIAGARISLFIGAMVTVIAGAIGIALGLIAGYFGGVADRVTTWLTDVQLAVPFIIVAIVLTAVLGNGVGTVVFALALTGWVGYARVVRLQSRHLRAAPWLEAARAAGAGPVRLMMRHLLPNLLPTIAILVTQQIAGVILYEAALSYLGLGVGGNAITWGGMVANGQEAMFRAWWVSFIPGLAVALTILALNFVSDEGAESSRRASRAG